MARILVIDDNADLLQMIRMLLEGRGGHEVILSAEGKDGLEKALAKPPDLAIIDVMMPGMTGYDVCRRLRQEPSTANMPIIILTARGQPVDRQAALEAGADEYMAKPVTMSDLLDRVNALLAQKPLRAAAGPRGGVIAVLSLRGGVGATTVAVNMAVSFALQSPERVCLVDFSPSSGHTALQLGLRPDPNWSALGLLSTPPSPSSIRNYLLTHASKLFLLAAPFLPVFESSLTPQLTGSIVEVLRHVFDTVVIDLPSVMNEGTMALLEGADSICVVTTADQASIQTTLGTLQLIKAWLPKVRLVLNQVVPAGELPVEALQRVMKQPFAAVIPFDERQGQALAHGKPLAFVAPESPLAQSVSQLVQRLNLVAV